MFNDLLILLAILILLVEIYRKMRQTWLRHQLSCRKMAKGPRKPAVPRPKCERDCRFCQEDKRKRKSAEREKPVAWALRKGRGGRKNRIPKEDISARTKPVNITGSRMRIFMGWWVRERKGQAVAAKVEPRFQMPGVWDEVHDQAQHNLVSFEKPLRFGGENSLAVVYKAGYCGSFTTDALEEVFGLWEITIPPGYAAAAECRERSCTSALW